LKELENRSTNKEIKNVEKLLGNESYIFNNYNYLYNIFQEVKYANEKWHEFTREVLVSSESLYYMYDRVIRLIRSFQQPKESFLEIGPDMSSTRVLERFFQLNKLLELFSEFVYQIYPEIQRRLKFEVETLEMDSPTIKGKILWSKTINRSLSRGLTSPISFVKHVDESHFHNPENFVFILCILKLYSDSLFLINFPFREPLRSLELQILNKIKNSCIVILKNTILQDLISIAKKYLILSFYHPIILKIEQEFKNRIGDNIVTNKGYRLLYHWFLKYKHYNIKVNSPRKNNFPITSREHLDAMFELYVLLELLNYFAQRMKAEIKSFNVSNNREDFKRRFSIKTNNISFSLFYEKWYYLKNNSTWSLNSHPDFTVEVDGKVKVIMDAKNWMVEKVDEAEYKMLGYLNNQDGNIGILFFPEEKSRITNGLKVIRPELKLKNHIDQCLVDCVLPISPDKNSIDNKNQRLEKVTELILDSLHT
jgi:hypothetical protein